MRRALLSSRFIRLALGSFIVTVATLGLQVHFIPMIVGGGVDRASAATMAGMIGIGAIVGRLSCGFLLDRWRGQIVGAIFFAIPAVSSWLLVDYAGSVPRGIAIAGLLGLGLGSELDVIAFLISRYFGLRNYGTLVGTITGGLVLAGGLGPTLAGSIYDATASYRWFVAITIPMFLLGAAMIASLGDYAARSRPARPA